MDAFCILNLTTGPVTELSIIRCIYCAYSFKIPAYAVDLCSLLSFYIRFQLRRRYITWLSTSRPPILMLMLVITWPSIAPAHLVTCHRMVSALRIPSDSCQQWPAQAGECTQQNRNGSPPVQCAAIKTGSTRLA